MKPPESFDTDSQVHGLRVDLSSRNSLLLPFDQFLFAELDGEVKDQSLRLVFATHEVMLRGAYLSRVETAVQKKELAFVAKVSTDYRSAFVENQAVIFEIAVTEAKPKEAKATNDTN
jgi:hypothetical protein